jgi:hypothetical protein
MAFIAAKDGTRIYYLISAVRRIVRSPMVKAV